MTWRKMLNYLRNEDLDIKSFERKIVSQLQTQFSFKIKSHFRSMLLSVVCEWCFTEESTTKPTQ